MEEVDGRTYHGMIGVSRHEKALGNKTGMTPFGMSSPAIVEMVATIWCSHLDSLKLFLHVGWMAEEGYGWLWMATVARPRNTRGETRGRTCKHVCWSQHMPVIE